jgi:predicted Zn-dependent protease
MSLVNRELATRALERALRRGGDFAELYAEDRRSFALTMDDGRVERPQLGREVGASIRVVRGEASYFGYVDGLREEDVLRVAGSVAQALRGETETATAAGEARLAEGHPVERRPESVEAAAKADLLRACDERARSAGAEVAQARMGYGESRRLVEVWSSDGRAAADDRTRIRLSAQVVARRGDRAETGSDTRGGHAGFELLADRPEEVAASAAQKALALLDAREAPTGRLPVVVGNGFGGVLLHEAVGHGLEADAVQKGASVWAGRIGEPVAESFVTAYDDGRRTGAWGSDGIDDEGTPTRRTTIVEEGRLVSFLYDRVRARKEGVDSTGNGRRQSFRHLPIPRMTNTYFGPGEATVEELIGGVERGLYAVSFGGGQVEPATGDFVFGVSEGYLIEGGRVTAPVRGATLVGNGPEALRAVDGIAGDLEIATGFWEGRPVGAGGRRPAARADPRADGRGDGRMSSIEAATRRAVEAAMRAGAEEAEAWGEETVGRQVRVYDGAVESLSDAGGRGVGVRVFLDGRSGYAYGTDLSEEGLTALGRTAQETAAVADPDEHEGLPEELGATPVDGLHSGELAGWSTERKVELALEVERAARAPAGVTQVEAVVYADAEVRVAIANSRDFAAGYESTQAWSYASAFAGEGSELMTGLGVGLGRDPGALDPDAIGGEAAERALALVGARRPESRRCPVLLDAFVAASIVGIVGGMLSADAVQRGRSAFAGREGDEIGAPALGLADDSTDPAGPGSAPFDGEGSPSRRTALVEGGRLLTFLFDTRTARKAGRTSTGNASRGSYRSPPGVGSTNLVLEPGGESLEQLAARARDGLYVTDVAGLHSGVDPVSGTFSVGASGRLIEDGELGRPVRELTVASDLLSMLRGVSAVGSESRWVPFGGGVRAAPILIEEMAVSGS